MTVIDLTENRLIPEALKSHKAFQGDWWENKNFWNQGRSRAITGKLGGFVKKLRVRFGGEMPGNNPVFKRINNYTHPDREKGHNAM